MNRNTVRIVGLTVSMLLMACFAVTTAAAFPDDSIREKVFETYPADPSTVPNPGTAQWDVYGYSGIHWKDGTTNVAYLINTKGAPTGAAAAVAEAFETWDFEIGDTLFSDTVGTASARLAGNKYDGKNVISWGRLGRNIIAQTTVWYNRYTNEIVEFGMVFSTAYKWGIDTDGEESGFTLTNAFDVQNIATHEAGHTLMLDDLYMPEAKLLTMYGYGDYGETYAISLGKGDITGIRAISP